MKPSNRTGGISPQYSGDQEAISSHKQKLSNVTDESLSPSAVAESGAPSSGTPSARWTQLASVVLVAIVALNLTRSHVCLVLVNATP
jgi:hypothetical protein